MLENIRVLCAFRWARTGLAVGLSLCLLALMSVCGTYGASAKDARGHEVDTEHLFGFTLGTDIGEKGEREYESDASAHIGKNGGSYAAMFEQLEAKYTVSQSFRIAAAAALAYHNISNVPDLQDRREASFQGLRLDARFRLLDRERSPVGFTVIVEPRWSQRDEVTGEHVQNHAAAVTLALDREIIPQRLYAAFNLLCAPETTRLPDAEGWVRQSTLGIGGAVVAQVTPGVFLGAEVRSLRLYDGFGLNSVIGQALYVGPTFYAVLSKHSWLSAAWSTQVSGRVPDQPGALDLVNYERHRALLRFGYHF